MKATLQKLFSPILSYFDAGDNSFHYRSSHRAILVLVGCLFLLLTIGIFIVGLKSGLKSSGLGYLLPGLIFGGAAFLTLLVGFLGSDRAVAKIWGACK